jgi:protoheme IX farnesyltransferase
MATPEHRDLADSRSVRRPSPGRRSPFSALRARLRDYLELTKPNIVGLILVTVAAGYYLGAGDTFDLLILTHTLVGTALIAGASNALNQILEREIDARMRRTQRRPLPSGRLRVAESAVAAWVAGAAGVLYLAAFTNLVVVLLAIATLASYVFVYTPLKRITSLCTIVGAVPGALPVLGGWAAARAGLDLRAWVLFTIVFLWQIPHFLALAWLFREDYARAGLRMLSVTAGAGATFRQALGFAVALLPVSLAPAVLGMAGPAYLAGAAALALWQIWATVRVARDHAPVNARRLFLASVTYLPVLLGLMAIDKV